MKRKLKALWSLITCDQCLLVTYSKDKQGEVRTSTHAHNMTVKEVERTVGVMFCHFESEEALRQYSELLAKGLTMK